MALTSGAKKFSVLLLLACVVGGGIFYFVKNKPKVITAPPAVEQTVAPAPVVEKIVEAPVAPIKKVVEEVKPVKKHVTTKHVEKKKKVHRSSESHGVSQPERTRASGNSDAAALKELAGDKL